MDRRQDPRTIVTPYAFSVHPDLLGQPLATPWQRLGAIGIDLIVVLGLTRIGGSTLAVASGLLLFWLALRTPAKDSVGQFFRVSVGCLGLAVIGITFAISLGLHVFERLENDPEAREALRTAVTGLDSAGVDLRVGGFGEADSVDLGVLAGLVPDVFALRQAGDSAEAAEITRSMAFAARESGMSLQDIRVGLESLMPRDAPWSPLSEDIIDQAVSDLRVGLGEGPGEETGDLPGEEGALVPVPFDSAAMDSLAVLNRLVATLDEERRDAEDQLVRTRRQLEEAEEASPLGWLWNLIDDLGLGFGWGALYLTITHALWKGKSVGKKLFRIRVVMIDKRPLNLWLSFERAGGYAAGFATGLLGFAQVFWDPNRQAIHDKVSETIVIQDGKDPVPGPWIAEGKAQWDKGRSPREDRQALEGVQKPAG